LGNRVEKQVEKLLDEMDVGGSVFKRVRAVFLFSAVSTETVVVLDLWHRRKRLAVPHYVRKE
jgi:hypothetical protein